MKLALVIGYGAKATNEETVYNTPLGCVRVFYDFAKELAKAGHEVWLYWNCTKKHEIDFGNLHLRDYMESLYHPFRKGEMNFSSFDWAISFEGWDKEIRRSEVKKAVISNMFNLAQTDYDKIICVSKSHMEHLKGHHEGISDKLSYIHWGVNFDPIDKLPKGNRKKGDLFYSGNPTKGLDNIRRVFDNLDKIISGLQLEVISSRLLYFTEDLQKHVQLRENLVENQKNITCSQPVSFLEHLKILRNKWIYFAPQTFSETFGLAFLEAAATGTPIITIDRPPGNNKTLVETLDCGIVANGNRDFVEKFLMLYNDEELWQKYHINGVKNAREIYSWANCVNKLETILGG